jgi:hypothetical protein
MRGPREGIEGNNHFHVNASVGAMNPCVTNTPTRTPLFRQPSFGRRRKTRRTSTQGTTTGGAILGNISQGSTLHRGSSLT